MIDFRFTVEIDGIERGLRAVADSIEDVTTPLLRAGGHIRANAERAFNSEGDGQWPALDPETAKRKLHEQRLYTFRGGSARRGNSVATDIIRTSRSMAKQQIAFAKASPARREASERNLLKKIDARNYYMAQGRAIMGTKSANELIGLARAEVARKKQRGAMMKSMRVLKQAGIAITDDERRAMYRKGQGRYAYGGHTQVLKTGVQAEMDAIRRLPKSEQAAARKALTAKHGGNLHDMAASRMLSNLAATIGMQVQGTRLSVYSKCSWSAVHNDGGTAGHGATIKQREFLAIDERALDILVEAIEENAITAWKEAT